MTVFVLRPEDDERIKQALERAREYPVPIAKMRVQHQTVLDEKDVLDLKDRTVEPLKKHIEQVMIDGGWRLAISCEEQPIGFVAHLSLSSPVPGRVPVPEAIMMILRVLGLENAERKGWLEEFDPGHYAVNVLALLREPQATGHA